MKIGIIGTGNIANAIIGGSLQSGKFAPESFCVFDVFAEKIKACEEKFSVCGASSAAQLVKDSDVVVIAVKPNDFAKLLNSLDSELIAKKPLLISVAAGLSLEYIESLNTEKLPVARIMTNINASIGEAMTAYCFNEKVSDAQQEFVDTFCNSFGDGLKLDESYFALFAVLAGCVPAFAYMFVDQLARAGVKIGFNKQLALRIAAQTVLGSAKLITQSDAHPYELIDRVCTPNGTTIEGIAALQEYGFENAIIKAVDASFTKDLKLAQAKQNAMRKEK